MLAALSFIMLSLTISCSKNDEEAVTPSLSLRTEEFNFQADGGVILLVLDVNTDWTAEADQDWVHLDFTSGTGKETNPHTAITLFKNPTTDVRTATVTVRCGSIVKTAKVTQKGQTAIEVTTDNFAINADGGLITIPVASNTEFTVTANSEWISQVETRALTTENLTFNISANESYDARKGSIVLTSADKKVTRTINIEQSQIYLIRVNGDMEYNVGIEGAVVEVQVESSMEYSFDIPVEASTWISDATKTTRALTSATHKFKVEYNENYDPRSSYITFNGENGDKVNVNINQKGNPILNPTPSSMSVDYKGGSNHVNVTSNFNYAVKCDADWITNVAKDETGISFEVSSNNSWKQDRQAEIVLYDNNSELTKVVTVVQTINPNPLIGTWTKSEEGYEETYIFEANGKGHHIVTGEQDSYSTFKYSYDAKNCKITITEDGETWSEEIKPVSENAFEWDGTFTKVQPVENLLVGTWVRNSVTDGKETYTFNADGTAIHTQEGQKDSSFKYVFYPEICTILIIEDGETWAEKFESLTATTLVWDGTFTKQ